jgi:hypothetical protein
MATGRGGMRADPAIHRILLSTWYNLEKFRKCPYSFAVALFRRGNLNEDLELFLDHW